MYISCSLVASDKAASKSSCPFPLSATITTSNVSSSSTVQVLDYCSCCCRSWLSDTIPDVILSSATVCHDDSSVSAGGRMSFRTLCNHHYQHQQFHHHRRHLLCRQITAVVVLLLDFWQCKQY
jgi:hypothetical protein